MPNPWDAGSARVLASLGFAALATTSSGFAATLGRLDGNVTLDEALAHAAVIAAADRRAGLGRLRERVRRRARRGGGQHRPGGAAPAWPASRSRTSPAGPMIPIYDAGLAAERVAAAAEAAHGGPVRLVLTARAENFLHGRPDLADTIARLQATRRPGADVLYAPGLTRADDIRAVVTSRRPAGQRPGLARRPRRWPSWPGWAWPGSRSAARSPTPRSTRWPRRAGSCSTSGTYGYLKQTVAGRQVAGEAFRP